MMKKLTKGTIVLLIAVCILVVLNAVTGFLWYANKKSLDNIGSAGDVYVEVGNILNGTSADGDAAVSTFTSASELQNLHIRYRVYKLNDGIGDDVDLQWRLIYSDGDAEHSAMSKYDTTVYVSSVDTVSTDSSKVYDAFGIGGGNWSPGEYTVVFYHNGVVVGGKSFVLE